MKMVKSSEGRQRCPHTSVSGHLMMTFELAKSFILSLARISLTVGFVRATGAASPENARLPDNYGIYVFAHDAWQPLAREGSAGQAAKTVEAEIPSILIFERQLAFVGVAAHQIAAMRPAHRITRIIEERASYYSESLPDLVRYAMFPTSMVVHVDSDAQVPLTARPVAHRTDMMVVSTEAKLASGLYRVSIMGDEYLIELKTSLPPPPELIQWYKTVDNQGRFSWRDTFRGNPVDESSYRTTMDYETLKNKLAKQLNGSITNLNDARALAYQTAEFNEEMSIKARALYSKLLIATLRDYALHGAHTDVIEWANIAHKDKLLGAVAYSIYTNAAAAVAAMEQDDLQKWQTLMEDGKSLGGLVRRIPCSTPSSDKAYVEVYERGLAVIEHQRWSMDPIKTNLLWFGNIYGVEFKPRGSPGLRSPFGDGLDAPHRGPPSVDIKAIQAYGEADARIMFDNQSSYAAFEQAFQATRKAWEERLAPLNRVEILARPGSWSQKIHVRGCPFNIEPAPGEARMPYQVKSSDGEVVEIITGKESLDLAEWLQVRSLSTQTVRLVLNRIFLVVRTEQPESSVEPAPFATALVEAESSRGVAIPVPTSTSNPPSASDTVVGTWNGSAKCRESLFKTFIGEFEVVFLGGTSLTRIRRGGPAGVVEQDFKVLSVDAYSVTAELYEGNMRCGLVLTRAKDDPDQGKLAETWFRIREDDDPMYWGETIVQMQRASDNTTTTTGQ